MKTNISQRVRGLWLQGAAAAIATGLAAFAPIAHAQTGTLTLSNPSSCSTFSGFTWNGSVLSVTCTATGTGTGTGTGTTTPGAIACDATQPGGFAWQNASGSGTPGSVITGTITRTGGCKGAYTITFGNNAPTGVTVSPAASVTFADGSASGTAVMAQPVSITTATSTPVGTQIAVWLNGWSSSTNSPAPGIAGTFTATVTATAPAPTPTPTPTQSAITYSGALTNNVQLVWGTNSPGSPDYSQAPFKSTDIASYSFTYGGNYGQVVFGAVSNYLYGGVADTEFAISSTAGDFPGTPNCDVKVPASSAGSGSSAINVWTPTHTGPFCQLNIGQTYYLNMRQVSATAGSTAASCPDQRGCALRMQPSGLN